MYLGLGHAVKWAVSFLGKIEKMRLLVWLSVTTERWLGSFQSGKEFAVSGPLVSAKWIFSFLWHPLSPEPVTTVLSLFAPRVHSIL